FLDTRFRLRHACLLRGDERGSPGEKTIVTRPRTPWSRTWAKKEGARPWPRALWGSVICLRSLLAADDGVLEALHLLLELLKFPFVAADLGLGRLFGLGRRGPGEPGLGLGEQFLRVVRTLPLLGIVLGPDVELLL